MRAERRSSQCYYGMQAELHIRSCTKSVFSPSPQALAVSEFRVRIHAGSDQCSQGCLTVSDLYHVGDEPSYAPTLC